MCHNLQDNKMGLIIWSEGALLPELNVNDDNNFPQSEADMGDIRGVQKVIHLFKVG